MWWERLLVAAAVLAAVWLALALVLVAFRPDRVTIGDALRFLPDLARLLRRLSADRTLPWRSRLVAGLLLAYLASPIDLVPDFVPLIGYAEDVIVATFVVRHILRRAGAEKLREHWPGSAEGFAVLLRLCGAEPPG